MRILFIHRFHFFEPQSIISLSAILKMHGHTCFFIDTMFEKNINKTISIIAPDIIAYSVTTGSHNYYTKLNLKLKKTFAFISIFGGVHTTSFPEFIHEEGVDIICIGEGEYAFLELVENLKNNKEITSIRNLWIKKNGIIHKNALRNLIDNLDELPLPDRELLKKYAIYSKLHTLLIQTARGCYNNCSFCFSPFYNKIYTNKGKVLRKRSVNNVIEELLEISRNYTPKRIQFVDDTFNSDYDWAYEFLDLYKQKIKLPFYVFIRAGNIEDDFIKKLKEAGCSHIEIGVESGNEDFRKSVLLKNISDNQIINTISAFIRNGIKVMTLNILALPDETIDMAFQTININIKARPTYSSSSIFTPLPSTKLYEYSLQRGFLKDNSKNILGKKFFFSGSLLVMNDINKLVRLHYLFNFTVNHPKLIPIIKLLIKLPFDSVYKLFKHFDRAWNYIFVINKIDIRSILLFIWYRLNKK